MKINVLYSPLINDDGAIFGTTRIEFPMCECTEKEILSLIGDFAPYTNLFNQAKEGDFSRFALETHPPEDWGVDCDIWGQQRTEYAASLNEALFMYNR